MLHGARCKYRTQKIVKKSPSGHHRTTLSGYIFAIKAYIDNRKKNCYAAHLLHMLPQYGELRPTYSGWERSGSLGHPCHHVGLGIGPHSSYWYFSSENNFWTTWSHLACWFIL